jgi:hypothetical protein
MNKNELKKLVGHKRHKYGAVRVTCKLGHQHPSKAEAMHCWALQAKINHGTIRDLEYEKPYDLIVNGKKVGVHKPDFTFKAPTFKLTSTGPMSAVSQINWDNPIICVDEVKGFRTKDWIFRSKMFQALYPEVEYRVVE